MRQRKQQKKKKISEAKSWFFENINVTDEPLAKLINKTMRGVKSIKLEMKKKKLQQITTEIQRIIRDHDKQLNSGRY